MAGKGVALKSVDFAGGAQIAGGQTKVKMGGLLFVLLGDPVEPHPPFPPHTTNPVMAQGSARFKIAGVPVCREGHLASCGHATTGRPRLRIPG